MAQIIAAGIDPGPNESSIVIWDGEKVKYQIEAKNEELLLCLEDMGIVFGITHWGIERIRGYGAKAGNETFDTCEWIGRFDLCLSKATSSRSWAVEKIPRKTITAYHCGHATAGDSDCWKALRYRFGEPGAKKNPGVLFGIKGKHLPAALAVAVYVHDMAASEVVRNDEVYAKNNFRYLARPTGE